MTDESKELVPARDALGRFVQGASGNPAGRPTGRRNRATVLRELLDQAALDEIAEDYLKVIRAMIEVAQAGDVQAAKFLKEIVDIVRDENDSSGRGKIVVRIDNFTITQGESAKPIELTESIEGEYEEVTNERSEDTSE